MFGASFSQLAGVVLFNFTFSITVPSWLQEKRESVDPVKTIWMSTSFCAVLYVVFGLAAAMSFPAVGDNMLTLLASPRARHLTKVSAALFGFVIIGCGVPVFCVIVKNTLYKGRVCSAYWSLFW